MLLQVNMSTSAMVLKDAHRIMLKDIKASGSHRSMPVLPTAFIDGSLLSVDFLSAVTSAAVTVRNSATGEIVYSSVEMNDINHFMGYTKIDNDVTLAWGFPSNGAPFSIANYFGPAGIQYGLLSTTNAATGTIHCDDEDSNNKNWVQRYNLGYTLDNSFNESVALNDFGITENGNTTYSISLSTDAKFSKNNRFYPSRLY